MKKLVLICLACAYTALSFGQMKIDSLGQVLINDVEDHFYKLIGPFECRVEKIFLRCTTCEDTLEIEVEDHGKGIEDVTKAMEPLFTTRPELDRSGMGFSFMTAFMDQVEVSSEPGKGTIVKMKKTIGKGRKIWTTQSL